MEERPVCLITPSYIEICYLLSFQMFQGLGTRMQRAYVLL